jgi:hypothetical protein
MITAYKLCKCLKFLDFIRSVCLSSCNMLFVSTGNESHNNFRLSVRRWQTRYSALQWTELAGLAVVPPLGAKDTFPAVATDLPIPRSRSRKPASYVLAISDLLGWYVLSIGTYRRFKMSLRLHFQCQEIYFEFNFSGTVVRTSNHRSYISLTMNLVAQWVLWLVTRVGRAVSCSGDFCLCWRA